MAAQTWDTQLVAQIVSTGVGNTTSTGVGGGSVVSPVSLKLPLTMTFGVTAPPSQLDIAAASQATTAVFAGATTLDVAGALPGTSIVIETNTAPAP